MTSGTASSPTNSTCSPSRTGCHAKSTLSARFSEYDAGAGDAADDDDVHFYSAWFH